jgi:3-oxoacyl-[acyl-carrier-protein] synthase II
MSSSANGRRRVVITGLGMISPVGNDVATSWERLLAGTSGASTITQFEATEAFATRIACEVKDFDPSHVLDRKEARRYDRFAQFALVVADEAMRSAGLVDVEDDVEPERFGVIFGSGIGGIATFEEQSRTLIERGPGRVSPFFVPMFIPDIAAGLISIRYGAMGANFATVSACSSSAHAIGEATRTIERGDADRMIAGGAEATITPLTIAGFSSMKAMSTRNERSSARSWATACPRTHTTSRRRTPRARGPNTPCGWRWTTREPYPRKWTTSMPTGPRRSRMTPGRPPPSGRSSGLRPTGWWWGPPSP